MAIKVVLILVFVAFTLLFAILAGVNFYKANEDDGGSTTKGAVFTVLAILGVALFIFIPWNVHQVDTGEVAVVRNMGKVEGTREAGIYWDWYFTKSYELYDTKVQELEIKTDAYTLDKQTVSLDLMVQFDIDSANADKIATEYGSIDKVQSKMKAIALDNLKSIIAKNNADALIEKRDSVTSEVAQTVSNSIDASYYVNIKTVTLTNIDFTDDYEAAVAAKVAQQQAYEKALIEQQQALAAAENDKAIKIAQAEAEAESTKLAAQAAAEVVKIQAEADAEKAKIEADAAAYQGEKNAIITLKELASVNGWMVETITSDDGSESYRLVHMDEAKTAVTNDELAEGVKNYIEYKKIEAWDGELPQYQMGDSGIVTVVTP